MQKIKDWIETIRVNNSRVILSRSKGGTFAIGFFVTLMSLFMLLPVIYSVVQAFKPIDEIYAFPPRFFVRNPTIANFKMVLRLAGNLWVPFSRYLFNSLLISVAGTFIQVFIGTLASYPLAKGRFPGRKLMSSAIVWAMLFNGSVTTMPRYLIIAGLGMVDTYWAILLPAMASTMGVFLMRQFMRTAIPDSTLEAARIDGANEFTVFFRIVVPSVRAGWMTLVIFAFQGFWNSANVTYIYSENLKQLPSVLSSIAAGGIARAGASSAVAVIMMVLPMIVFLISQSSITETMSHSGLK